MSPRRSERLRKLREANTVPRTFAIERSAAPRRSGTRGRSTQRRSGAVERRTVLRVPQCNMREPRRTSRRQLSQTAPVEEPFPPIPIPIEMRSSLQSNSNNLVPTASTVDNNNNNSDVSNDNNNNNSSVSPPNNISGENQNEELRRSLISLVIRIAVTESPSLPELVRRNPMQGMKKLFRIIRFLFYRR